MSEKKTGYAKIPAVPPQFDATAFTAALQKGTITATMAKQFVAWKRWVEATAEQDGKGLNDVVKANAYGLTALKVDLDGEKAAMLDVKQRLTALETRPASPFPGSF